VGDLARRGLIDEVPGRTTGEHRDQMREVRPAVSPEFDEAAELFDGAWYGRAHVDADDDDHFKVLALDVMTAAERRK
jgi:nitrogen fixation protein FixH